MMNLYKKSVHSLLSFNNSKDNNYATAAAFRHHPNIPSPSAGLTFLSLSDNAQKNPTNVLESATFKSPPPPSTTAAAAVDGGEPKRDPGGIGFLDDVGGSVDGLMSCTESLGFESTDEWRVDDKIDNVLTGNNSPSVVVAAAAAKDKMVKRAVVRREKKSFPPPLTSLNEDGKPSFFLRPVRKDGRLELTEVQIYRPEILRASREDGRLRLNFICDDVDQVVDNNNDNEEEKEEVTQEEEQTDEEKELGWRLSAVNGGGDGFRWCHEDHHHHRNDLHVWRPQPHCVTIR